MSQDEHRSRPDGDLADLRRKVWIVLAQILVVGAAALLLWHGLQIVLLVFGGILLSVFLNAPSRWISHRLPLGYRPAVFGVSILVTVLIVLLTWWQGPRIASQVSELTEEIPTSLEELRIQLRQTSWGDAVLTFLPGSDGGSDGGAADGEAEGSGNGDSAGGMSGTASDAAQRAFRMVTGGVLNGFVVLFLGIYFALAPRSYREAIVSLLPERHREAPRRSLLAVGNALRYWILGRLATMVFTAVVVAIGLYLFGIPLVFVLALFAGIMNFIPYIGPVLGALPAVLFAWSTSPGLALQVILFFWGVQIVESFIVTPLVQKKAVSIPPALLIISQIFMGLVAGMLGVLLATPLAVTIMVLVQTLYVEETLDEEVHVLGT